MTKSVALEKELTAARRKVDVDHLDLTLRELLLMTEDGELRRAPVYQRKFRWDEEAESRLIESLLLGLPVPSFYMATNTDGSWEVVDGLQRISTILHFLAVENVARNPAKILKELPKDKALRLTDLVQLPAFNGATLADIPTSIRLNFLRTKIKVTALSDKSDFQIRFETFERLNTGGLALSPQEVRGCIYRGDFNQLVSELANHEPYKLLLKLQRKRQHDGTREEVVLKFFAYLYDRDNFTGSVKKFLNAFMSRKTEDGDFDRTEWATLFKKVVTHVYECCSDGPFLKSNTSVTPLNQLEAVLVGCGEVLLQGGTLVRPADGWQDDIELVEASTGATNTRAMLERRIARARDIFGKSTSKRKRKK